MVSQSNLFRVATVACLLWASSLLGAQSTAAQEIQGAGSTFVAPIIAKWSEDYAKISGVKIAYQAVGSGAGIDKIRSGAVDFGATDKPLSPEELEKGGLCQFPIVIGGIVPVVNLPGVLPGKIKFSGALLAEIFLGNITRWDAAEIKAINPDLALPDVPISVVHRSDGSGTTFNWVDFLSKASPLWKTKVGVGLSVNWPIGVGGNGNAGVAATVKQTTGSIGYVEYAYALQSNLAFGLVGNAYKLFVVPGPDSFQAAAASVRWRDHKDFSVLMTDAGGPDAYPIAATTFILMYKTPNEPGRSSATLAFFKWALESGDKQASELHYVAIPPTVTNLIEAYWASEIKTQAAQTTN